MRRFFSALAVVGLSVAMLQAHALYLLNEDGKITVVFSDELAPDARVKEASWKKVGVLKLQAVNAAGKTSEATCEMAEASMKATVPADTVLVNSHTPYGISAHGGKARFIHFYTKAVLVSPTADVNCTLGKKCPLEVVPVVTPAGVRFQVLAGGKPVSKLEATIIVPEKEEKVTATTDDQGMTQAFEAKGRYGVTVRNTEAKSGEVDGEKYEETMHVATLVVDVK